MGKTSETLQNFVKNVCGDGDTKIKKENIIVEAEKDHFEEQCTEALAKLPDKPNGNAVHPNPQQAQADANPAGVDAPGGDANAVGEGGRRRIASSARRLSARSERPVGYCHALSERFRRLREFQARN